VVAYNFSERFAPLVESGVKRQTIRKPRVNGHAGVDDWLQLYTGQRTPQCRLLREARCHDVCGVLIERDRFTSFKPQEFHDLDYIAKADGFVDWSDMRKWFDDHYGLPFRGVMIRWLVPIVQPTS
jgi:hypothetical protein